MHMTTLAPSCVPAMGSSVDVEARVALIGDATALGPLGDDMASHGYTLVQFDSPSAVMDYLGGGGRLAVILVSWDVVGLEALRRARAKGLDTPLVVVAGEFDATAEELALEHGALDYIDLSRRASIIMKRLAIVMDGAKAAAALADTATTDAGTENAGVGSAADIGMDDSTERLVLGDLRLENARAYWKGSRVDLTLTEFRMVHLLASKTGNDLSYRDLYDLVHGAGFVAGYGNQGYRANVRAFIKRIRSKFRSADETFEAIGNYPGFGYRWGAANDAAADERVEAMAAFAE